MDDEKAGIYSQIRSDFIKNYKRKAVPFFKIYEKKRTIQWIKALLLSVFITLVLIYLILIYFGLVGIEDIDTRLFKFCFPFFFLFLIGFLFIFKKAGENQLKKAVMPCICECFGDIKLKWFCGSDMTKADKSAFETLVKKSRVLSNFWRNNSWDFIELALIVTNYDDIFHGIYGGIKFDIHEIEVIKFNQERYKKSIERVFDGIIVKLDMNKSFKGNTIIVPSGTIVTGLSRTVLEDADFEKRFDIYTSNAIEARYLITTAFMERLKEIKAAFRNRTSLSCSFYQNSLILALDNRKDWFSFGSYFKKADYLNQCLTMIDEILSIIKLIDHFKLDEKIRL